MSPTTNDETLLMLLTVARESEAEREKILSILKLQPTRRKIAVNILVTEMRRNNAPDAFVAAWDSLQDDSIADAAKGVIEDNGLEARTQRATARIGYYVLVVGILAGLGYFFIWIFTGLPRL